MGGYCENCYRDLASNFKGRQRWYCEDCSHHDRPKGPNTRRFEAMQSLLRDLYPLGLTDEAPLRIEARRRLEARAQ